MFIRLLLIATLTLLSVQLCGQSKGIKRFYKKYKRTENTFNMNAPGWLIRLGVSIAAKDMNDDPSEKAALSLVKKIRKARLLLMEDKRHLDDGDLSAFFIELANEGFESVVETRDEGSEVDVMVVYDKEYIKKMIVLVNEEDSFSMLALKTKIHEDDLEDVLKEADFK